jgi:hypothetical protein
LCSAEGGVEVCCGRGFSRCVLLHFIMRPNIGLCISAKISSFVVSTQIYVKTFNMCSENGPSFLFVVLPLSPLNIYDAFTCFDQLMTIFRRQITTLELDVP